MSETATTEQPKVKQEQPEGFFTHDDAVVEIPFGLLKHLFYPLKQFEFAVAAMHNIQNAMVSSGASKAFYKKDVNEKTGEFTKEFVESCKPKEKKSMIITDEDVKASQNGTTGN